MKHSVFFLNYYSPESVDGPSDGALRILKTEPLHKCISYWSKVMKQIAVIADRIPGRCSIYYTEPRGHRIQGSQLLYPEGPYDA